MRCISPWIPVTRRFPRLTPVQHAGTWVRGHPAAPGARGTDGGNPARADLPLPAVVVHAAKLRGQARTAAAARGPDEAPGPRLVDPSESPAAKALDKRRDQAAFRADEAVFGGDRSPQAKVASLQHFLRMRERLGGGPPEAVTRLDSGAVLEDTTDCLDTVLVPAEVFAGTLLASPMAAEGAGGREAGFCGELAADVAGSSFDGSMDAAEVPPGFLPVAVRFQQFAEFDSFTFIFNKRGTLGPGGDLAGALEVCLRQGDQFLDWLQAEGDWLEAMPGETLLHSVTAVVPGEGTFDEAGAAQGRRLAKDAPIERELRAVCGVFSELQCRSDKATIAGCSMCRGASRLYANYKLTDQGRLHAAFVYDQKVLEASDVRPEQGYTGWFGRQIQRFLELEQYRLLALMALPTARRLAGVLNKVDDDILASLTRISASEINSRERKKQLRTLSELKSLSEEFGVVSRDRFRASEAYAQVVDSRLERMKPAPIFGLKSFEGFVKKRLDPARRTFKGTTRMLDETSASLQRALDILEVQIESETQATSETLVVLGTILSVTSLLFSLGEFEYTTGVGPRAVWRALTGTEASPGRAASPSRRARLLDDSPGQRGGRSVGG